MSGFNPHRTYRAIASAMRLSGMRPSGQRGQTLVETGLILSLVAAALVAAFLAVSGELSAVLANVVSGLNG
jgi:Flp pilus assembly pilin Flp